MTTKPKKFKIRFSYANVMATVAMFLAVGGGGALAATQLGRGTVGNAQLKPGAITGVKVKDGSLTGADVVASSLGKVPAAGHADSAASADRAATAGRSDNATRADTAGHADTAAHADQANRADDAVFAERAAHALEAVQAASLTEPEHFHYVNESGEPKANGGFKLLTSVTFYRDQEGVVHLEGQVQVGSELGGALFQLPQGYTPEEEKVFYGVGPKPGTRVRIVTGGFVEIYPAAKEEPASLDGITFRADPRTEA
jgi:hypothetical protein